MRYLPKIAVAVLAIGWISGCAGNGDGDMPMVNPPAAGNLLDTYWRLVSMEGMPAQPVAEGRQPHLILHSEGNLLGASGGVNQMGGTWGVSGTAITLLPGAITRMAGPEPLMQQEDKFIALLPQVNRYEVTGDRLTLFEDSVPLMEFEAGQQP